MHCVPFPRQKHTEKQNGVSTDPGRKYISAAVVCEIGRLVPLMEKHTLMKQLPLFSS